VGSSTTVLILSSWSWEPLTLLVLIAAAGLYGFGLNYCRRQHGAGSTKPGQVWYFAAGLFTLFIALQSPIDTFSGQLFSMHMAQHLLMTLAAPPLLLLGTPGCLLTPFINWHPRIRNVLASLTSAAAAFLLFNGTLALWHIPFFYEATLQNSLVHELEHALFFWTALLSWWPLLSPVPALPRLSYPAQILYIFMMVIPGAILGAWLVFADRVLYPSYAAVPSLWNMTALEDQQLGGLLMMVPGKMIYFTALTIIFFRWFGQEEEPAGGGQLL